MNLIVDDEADGPSPPTSPELCRRTRACELGGDGTKRQSVFTPTPTVTVTVTASGAPASTNSPSPTTTPTGLATLTGPDMPASTGVQEFYDNMAQTKVFKVEGIVTITASITPDVSGDPGALVEGYLIPANFPSNKVMLTMDPTVPQFALTPYTGFNSETLDYPVHPLQGDYYVKAAGQDCSWSLRVTQQ